MSFVKQIRGRTLRGPVSRSVQNPGRLYVGLLILWPDVRGDVGSSVPYVPTIGPIDAEAGTEAQGAEKGGRSRIKRTTEQATRPPGRPTKHGARLFPRLFEQNGLDERTGPAKLLRSAADDLANDRGDWKHCAAAEEIAIRRAAFLAVLCSMIENWVLKAGPIVDGELAAILRKGYGTHQHLEPGGSVT